MDVKLLWLLLYTLFYNIFLSNGFKIKSVMFRVHGKQQGVRKGVRKCAMEILSNDAISGGRISDQTGTCEKLRGPLNDLETSESEYVEKVNFKQAYQPSVSSDEQIGIIFPGPPMIGSILDFVFVRKQPATYGISADIGPHSNSSQLYYASVLEDRSELNIFDMRRVHTIDFYWSNMCPSEECKISLVIQEKNIQLFVNDKIVPGSNMEMAGEMAETFLRQLGRVQVTAFPAFGATFKSFGFTKY